MSKTPIEWVLNGAGEQGHSINLLDGREWHQMPEARP